eukprot:CAMPEP_0184698506 /NCGR_PEP_ID=MMETSP0313-20130426/5118_1 /TAXON_ID=2792 /ORGANISM="Porphyridium aerugineum, Strain SAG 1380-2" /LENGTH=435 /DNA_ID=CAMNT_0027157469 /DNA_START=113 /DNA_END=1420 /DNA_ORIENTATION=-
MKQFQLAAMAFAALVLLITIATPFTTNAHAYDLIPKMSTSDSNQDEIVVKSFPMSDARKSSKEGLLLNTYTMHHENLPDYAKAKPVPAKKIEELPKVFDWSNVDGINYLVPNWNQHIEKYCGACYIHGTLSAAQDRIKIAKQAKGPDVMLSRQVMLNCIADGVGKHVGGGSEGCNGGTTQEVYGYMHLFGLPDETCNHWMAEATKKCDAEALCMNCMAYAEPVMENWRCWPVKNYTKYYVTSFGVIPKDEGAIMSEIHARGPIACSLATNEEFDYQYKGGVWTKPSSDKDSNHVVEITGWGETADGVRFWQARNSWGSYWGNNGFFKIKRGENLLLIEEDCWFVTVDWTEEGRLRSGDVVGGMKGIRDKPDDAKQDDLDFDERLQIHQNVAARKKRTFELVGQIVTFLGGIAVGGLAVALMLRRQRNANTYQPIA